MKNSNLKKIYIILFSFLILFSLIFLFCNIGSVKFSIYDIFKSIFQEENKLINNIVFNIRLPRNLIAVFAGAGLSVSGLLLQAVMKNPLADPAITGVSSGASLCAIVILLVVPKYSNILPLVSFLGGALSFSVVYLIAYKKGQINPTRIVLSGVAINSVLGGIISFLTIVYSDRIQGALLWLNGSFVAKTWSHFYSISVYVIFGSFLSLFCIKYANILALSDKSILGLGLNLTLIRLGLSFVAVFLAGIITSIVGIISFVGLIVPHISKMILGDDYRYTLPFSIALGGIVLLTADTIARTVGNSIEIPVGIIMALLGGPFFLYILRKKGEI